MVVSGSRMEQKLEDVSGPIAVITSEQIEEQVVSNVADLFRYEPGVSVQGGGCPDLHHSRHEREPGQGGAGRVRQNDAQEWRCGPDLLRHRHDQTGGSGQRAGVRGLRLRCPGGVIAITTKDAGDFLKGRTAT